MTKTVSSLDYIVQSHDTLEKIAAHHDCTPGQLMKLNKLSSRLIFPGQKIMVPDAVPEEIIPRTTSISNHSDPSSPVKETRKVLDPVIPLVTSASNGSGAGQASIDIPPECSQKFLKLKVKHFTDSEGVVAGVLLVTPNCVMFDPDVSHPLVIENGPDKYAMVAFMDVIVSAALYKDLPLDDNQSDNVTSKCAVYRTQQTPDSSAHSTLQQVSGMKSEPRLILHKSQSNLESRFSDVQDHAKNDVRRSLSDEQRSQLADELKNLDIEPKVHLLQKQRHTSESTSEQPKTTSQRMSDNLDPKKHVATAAPSSCPSDLEAHLRMEEGEDDGTSPSPIGNVGNLRRLRRSWRQRANTLGGTLAQGTQSIVQGTQSIGGTLIQGTIQGTQAVGRTFSLGAKVVARVPQNLVNMSSGIFAQQMGSDGNILIGPDGLPVQNEFQNQWLGSIEDIDEEVRDARRLRRQQQLDVLHRLKKKTAEMRENTRFTCATTKDDHAYLFGDIENILPFPMHDVVCAELPFYLCLKLLPCEKRRKKESSVIRNPTVFLNEFGDKMKSEFWFTIPRNKADTLYTFLIQWSPEKYGESNSDTFGKSTDETLNTNYSKAKSISFADEPGFVVIDGSETIELAEEPAFQPSSFPASLNLNREWEIVTVEEVKRRLSMLDLAESEIPLPEGSCQSLLLTEAMIRQLVEVLPARAQGYPWVLIYSSELHGFSLSTMYRNMASWQDELSPTLLIIKDSNQNVFGAVINCPLRLSDTFFGTGESLLYTFYPEFLSFPWKNVNNFIAKGNREGLAIGAGKGTFGLWLDSDLYRGRTQRCLTFDNEPLTATEDFLIGGIEAFGFRLGF